MSLLLGLQGVGLGLNILGGMQDAAAQARAARRSADWLDEQAKYFREVTDRKKEIFGRQSEQFKAAQALSTAGNGISLEGSFLETRNQTDALQAMELEAIEAAGRIQIREAKLKAEGLRSGAAGSLDRAMLGAIGQTLGSNVFAKLVDGGAPNLRTTTTGRDFFSAVGGFFRNEYNKGVGRKAQRDFHQSILEGGGRF